MVDPKLAAGAPADPAASAQPPDSRRVSGPAHAGVASFSWDQPLPTTGQTVRYVGAQGINAHRAAIISMAADTWMPEGEAPTLSSSEHVHLHVFTPSAQGYFVEYDVPFDPAGAPGSWHWPPQT